MKHFVAVARLQGLEGLAWEDSMSLQESCGLIKKPMTRFHADGLHKLRTYKSKALIAIYHLSRINDMMSDTLHPTDPVNPVFK